MVLKAGVLKAGVLKAGGSCYRGAISPTAYSLVKRPPPIARSEYLIDRHLVVFEEGTGFHCVCKEFAMTRECRHTREIVGRRTAQTLIAKRVRSIDGTLVGFAHRKQHDESAKGKRARTRSLALVRVR